MPLLAPDELYRRTLRSFKPNADLSAFDWCTRNLQLLSGKWTPRRGRILKHFYDIATARITGTENPRDPFAHRCEQINLCTITQIQKTTFLLSLIGYLSHNYNTAIGLYMSRQVDYQRIKNRALLPMIEKTRVLSDLLPKSVEARQRALSSSDLTIGSAMLHLLNGNVDEDLRGTPLEYVFADEIEKLRSGGGEQEEGSPIEQMHGRQRTRPHSKLAVKTSSPVNLKGHAWQELCAGSHERLLVVCEDCGAVDYLNQDQMLLKSGIEGTTRLADFPPEIIIKEQLTRWRCPSGCMLDAFAVQRMLQDAIDVGRWIAGGWEITKDRPGGIWTPHANIDSEGRLVEIIPPETVIRSGWAGQLYSSFVTLDIAAASKVQKFDLGTIPQKKRWVNEEKCEPWLHVFTPTTTEDLQHKACAVYQYGMCPVKPDLIILTFDQQGNQRSKYWYPYVVRAYKRRPEGGAESWLIACGKAMNEEEREQIEEKLWPCGGELFASNIRSVDIANGHYRQHGYNWAADDPELRVCLWGDPSMITGETWKEADMPNPRSSRKTSRPHGVFEWRLHPHFWREVLQDHLMQEKHAAPFNLPAYTDKDMDFYMRSMTAEERNESERRQRGQYVEVVTWDPRVTGYDANGNPRHRKDNHWADCEKMNLALAEILDLNEPLTLDDLTPNERRQAIAAQENANNEAYDEYEIDDNSGGGWVGGF